MKIITTILSVIAIIFIFFNSTKVNVNNPFSGDSTIALITIVASLCVLILMQLLRVSKRIEKLSKNKK